MSFSRTKSFVLKCLFVPKYEKQVYTSSRENSEPEKKL